MSDVYEMLWDCHTCGTEKLLGKTHRFCPNCGMSQDPDWRYYPSDEEKVAVEDHVYTGVDVTCASCGELNSGAAEYCQQCGAPLTDAARARTLAAQERAEEEQFESSGSRDPVKERFEAEMARVGAGDGRGKRKAKGGRRTGMLAVGGALLLLLVGGLIFFFSPSENHVTVTGHSWERQIQVEQYRQFRTESWRDTPPSGDQVSIVPNSCRREQRGVEQIPDGQECTVRRVDQGDGTFREERQCENVYREEPIYGEMCAWTGMRWEDSRVVETSGRSLDDTPYWGEVELACAGQRRRGCEREAGRTEQYRVHLYRHETDAEVHCDFTEQARWAQMAVDEDYVIEVLAQGMGPLMCDTLKRAG